MCRILHDTLHDQQIAWLAILYIIYMYTIYSGHSGI